MVGGTRKQQQAGAGGVTVQQRQQRRPRAAAGAASWLVTHTVMSMSGSWLMLSAASSAFSTSSRIVVYRHLPGCTGTGTGRQAGRQGTARQLGGRGRRRRRRQEARWHGGLGGGQLRSAGSQRRLTLSNPAMVRLSAKNSAGLFCCSTSALPALGAMVQGGRHRCRPAAAAAAALSAAARLDAASPAGTGSVGGTSDHLRPTPNGTDQWIYF